MFLLGAEVVPLAEIGVSHQKKVLLRMKGTHIFATGTSCAPSRNMCVPPKIKVLLRIKGTHIFARGINCAPSRIRTYIDKCIHLLI